MYLKLYSGNVSDYLHWWLDTYCSVRLARNTYNGYRTNIDLHIVPYIGLTKLTDLEPYQVQMMYAALSGKGLSGTSVLYVHATFRKALNTALKYGMLEYNVLDYIDSPRKSRFHASVLDSLEVNRLLCAAKFTDVYVPILLAVSLGLRRGEILGLQWTDVDFKNKSLEVSHTATYYRNEFCISAPKTDSSCRSLLLNDFLYHALVNEKNRQYIQSLGSVSYNPYNLVFIGSSGQLISSGMLDKKFKRVLSLAGLPDIRFHDLRHTFATLLLKKNVPAKVVSHLLGHSTIGITLDTYSHVITEMQDIAVAAINEILDY